MLASTHKIDLPRKIVVGSGILGAVGKYLLEVVPRGSTILVVSGPTVSKKYYPVVRESLEEMGFHASLRVVGDASVDTAAEVAEEASRERFKVIAGLGGGKSIDVAKYASRESGSVFVSLPTVASHDGITSPFSSLKGFGKPVSKPAKTPDLIAIDIDAIAEAPRRYNIAGFGDLIGKYTAVLDWRLAHRLRLEYYGEYAANLALLSAKHVSQYAEEIALGTREGYRILLEALVSSGVSMCIAGSTRPASGSEHLFAHALHIVARNKPLHGEAVGVGTIMMSYLHGRDWRRIRKLLKKVGAPTNARELGVSEEEVVEALAMAAKIRPERYTILGEKGLTRDAAETLARKTGVI
ncbi:MAG: NAD(P)-dependent glycerol-1-phosphate dehydrogenase [Aeropyrum sp.]|nr:NAD(P)-dependent glycerol-1-phosphate dehydrogenase [Aeropyrum sp.]